MSFEIPAAWNPYITETIGENTIIRKATEFDLQNATTHIQPLVNSYILERLQYYKITGRTYGRLW